jgi:hypothetical protein
VPMDGLRNRMRSQRKTCACGGQEDSIEVIMPEMTNVA